MSQEPTQADTVERLEAALRRMPKMRREIFLALRLDDLSYEEIADRTGLSVKQVERHVARSMMTLHEAFERRPPLAWWKQLFRRIAAKLRR
jgi:RNA polymerase sigma-70 factor (ECF subfamily)